MRLPISIHISLRLMTILVVLVGLLGSIPPTRASASPDATTARLRIGVAADGLVRITPSELATALSGSGVDPAAVDPRTFALSSLGQPVAIRVVDANTNNIFDGADRIEFFGQKFRSSLVDALDRQQEEKYTDERVYWLEIGGTPGPRIADVAATPQGTPTPPTSYPTTVHAEVNNRWTPLWSLNFDTRDTWYWDRMTLPVGGTAITKTFTYTTPYPAAGFPGVVRLEVVPANPGNAGGVSPSHRVTVSLADKEVTSATWNGEASKVLAGSVSSTLLGGQTTSFQVRVIIQAPSTKESMYVNFWELDYRRLFRAYNDQLDFRAESAGLQEFKVTDFASSPVAVWDITNPTQPKRLTGVAMSGASNPYAARFRASPAAGDRFWMQTESSFAAPTSSTLRSDTTWLRAPSVPANSGPGADTLILTPAFLRDAAQTLATWHRAHGRRTLVVDIQDVYDEFTDGIRHPKAVRQMLAWAAGNWTAPAPAYLVLMGDGHVKLKNFVSPGLPVTNPIPPYLTFKDPWQGEIASDGLYGDYNGDDVPDVAVGRIPVNSLSEATPVLNKITHYDESLRLQLWQQRIVFAADRQPDSAGNFWDLSDEIINNYTPADLTSQRIYLGKTISDAAAGRTALATAINTGAFMVQWTGHAGPQIWSKEEMWRVRDVPLLTNSAALPVMITFNCLDGFFTDWVSSYQSLAEAMLLYAGGGSAAAISPAGQGVTSDQTAFRKILMDTMFKDGVRELGRAFLVAKQKYVQTYGMNYLMYQMNLFGDPAMRLPASGDIPQVPDVTATRSGNSVSLSWQSVTLNERGTVTTVRNYGIWRSTQPYFDPDAANCNCTKLGETTELSTVDNAITPIGDVANNYFYVVRAQNSAGWSLASSSTGSSRTGEFDFALTPGTQ